jgi:single-stranded-DNA-specific exonuclease
MNKINKKEVRRRVVNQADYAGLVETGVSPVMARLYASRNIQADSLLPDIGALPPKDTLEGCLDAGKMLADAVMANKVICILLDWDADGLSSGSIMIRALRSLGANVIYIIPSRLLEGYGLSPLLARRAKEMGAELLVTVDNGISAFAGVLEANRLSLPLIITDHHLVSNDGSLPKADIIVNPQIKSNKFIAKELAGCGVAFYVLGALREELKFRGFPKTFNMSQMLDLVSLGTVGDMMPLTKVNRAIVNMGINRIRAGQSVAGIKALLSVAGKNPIKTNTETIGFQLTNRINAVGRLETADIVVEMMTTDDIGVALSIASQLDCINKERRLIQSEMSAAALEMVENLDITGRHSLVVFDKNFHEGVVGLTSNFLKDRYNLPSCALTLAENGNIKGSFRSIPGVHVRDVLDLVDKRRPGLMCGFGGHSAAAGGSIRADGLDEFIQLFDQAVKDLASPEAFNPYILTDGELGHGEISYELVNAINAENWGQAFPTPLFEGTFRVISQKIVGGTHTKLKLQKGMEQFDAILFSHDEPLPETIHALYKIGINEYQGVSTVQLMIEAINESNA